jgi:hypothetical protein
MGRRVARGKTSRLKWVVVCVEVFAAKPRKRHVDEKCGLTGGLQAAEMADGGYLADRYGFFKAAFCMRSMRRHHILFGLVRCADAG